MPQNSASRIHAILVEARKIPGGTSMHDAWIKIFNVKRFLEDVSPILVELLRQLNEIEVEIREKCDNQKAEVRLKFVPQIRKALSYPNASGNFSDVQLQLSAEVLYSLEVLIHELDEEPDLMPDDLTSITEALDELFILVDTSDINKKLRGWIMNWLSMIRNGIVRYKISGARGLQEALIRIQGEADIFWPAFEKVEKESPKLHQKLLGLFDKACKVSDIVERCRKLCESTVAGYVGSFVLRRLGVESHDGPISQ